LGLNVGGNAMLSVYDLTGTSGVDDMWWAGASRSPIAPLSGDWHPD